MKRRASRGSAIMIVTFLVLLMTVAGLSFLKRSNSNLSFSRIKSDVASAQFKMESAYEASKNKIKRAIEYDPVSGKGILLSGKLQYVNGPTSETFNNISNTYAANQLTFLQNLVTQQAYSGAGTLNSAHEFVNFSTAFPTTWTDPDLNDSDYFQVQYTFTPIDMATQVSPQVLSFEYEYRLQVRAYGQTNFQTVGSDDVGVIAVTIQGAPFSQYAIFMNSMLNQNGSVLVFAGGNTSSQVQEVFNGPIHVNSTPYFYGHPAFTDLFTSVSSAASWTYYSVTNYTGCPTNCPTFSGGSQGGVTAIAMPTQIFNTLRLAAGDTANTAATNNTSVTNSELNGFLASHATGTVGSGSAALADGIYVPIDNASSKTPTGGILVQGDAQIQMDVVQGSSDFNSTQWGQLNTADQGCKFQKVSITSLTSGVPSRDIYSAAEPCNVAYVFNTTTPATAPVVLSSRINGNIHVIGKIDEFGGASRTRPAIATDFGITVSATKDIRIINDLQYEDAYYVTQAADGTQGTTSVATPTGTVSGGYLPTSQDVAPKIAADSTTVLGIISVNRNVYIHQSAPANINVHAAIYAGSSDAYDAATGYGCGSSGATTAGCGFGYEGWNSNTGMGTLKFLGGISQYKSQTLGIVSSTPKGYTSRYNYDSRFRNNITPPAFPVTDSPQAYGSIRPYRTWRLSQAQ